MLAYYRIPYKNVLYFLDNDVSEDILNSFYNKYSIMEQDDVSKNEQLAECISDEDIFNLGFDINELEDIDDSDHSYSDYMKLDEIIDILANTDEYILEDLMNHYLCNNLTDLAIVLTDDEINYLKDTIEKEKSEEEPYFEENYDIEYYNKSDKDYDESLDYLEDIPNDIDYYLLYNNDDYSVFAVNSDIEYNRFKENLDPLLIDDCHPLDIVDGLYCFEVTPHKFEINEEVVIRNELNPMIFDSNNKIKDDVREQILNYVDGALDYLIDRGIEALNINDILLIGSNAGYLYRDNSDIDIHIINTVPLQQEVVDNIFDYLKMYETENPMLIGNSRVELNLDNLDDLMERNKNLRVYSLKSNDWLFDSDKNDMFTPDDIDKVEGYEDIVSELEEQITNIIDSDAYQAAVALKAQIRQNRSDDLREYGALSMGNVIFKELRNDGYYGKLRDYIKNKEKSLGDNLDE